MVLLITNPRFCRPIKLSSVVGNSSREPTPSDTENSHRYIFTSAGESLLTYLLQVHLQYQCLKSNLIPAASTPKPISSIFSQIGENLVVFEVTVSDLSRISGAEPLTLIRCRRTEVLLPLDKVQFPTMLRML